jgi:hypothetical protein
MTFLVVLFAVIMVSIGGYGIASPEGLVAFVRRFEGQPGVWIGAAVRIVFGFALWRAGPSSRTPAVLGVLGMISLVSGIALPFIGAERLTRLVAWWSGRSAVFLRTWSAAAIAVGILLFWSTTT